MTRLFKIALIVLGIAAAGLPASAGPGMEQPDPWAQMRDSGS